MHSQTRELLAIVKRGEAEEIEAARDLVRPELLPELLAAYWTLPTWDDKAGLMQLFSDHFTTGGEKVMLDFLTAPTTEINDEYYTSGKIVALCQLAGTFELDERLWYNRPLCAAVIQRALAGEKLTLALVDALELQIGTTSVTPGSITFTARGEPVYAFAVSPLAWGGKIVGIIFWALIYLGIGSLGLWMGFVHGTVPPFNWRWLRDSLILFALSTVFFVPFLIIMIRGLITPYGPKRIKMPVAWEFYHHLIRFRFLRGDWEERSIHELHRIIRQELPFHNYPGGRSILEEEEAYILVLEFTDGLQLVIDYARGRRFGQMPARLYPLLTALYRK